MSQKSENDNSAQNETQQIKEWSIYLQTEPYKNKSIITLSFIENQNV